VSLFVDTSALYALLVRTEDGHDRVADEFNRALKAGRALLTSNYVLLETTALLQHQIGLEAVRDLSAGIVPLLRTHWITEDLHRLAVDRLLRGDRRRVSLVDETSFLVMESEGVRDALALDRHFEEEGFRVVPRPASV